MLKFSAASATATEVRWTTLTASLALRDEVRSPKVVLHLYASDGHADTESPFTMFRGSNADEGRFLPALESRCQPLPGTLMAQNYETALWVRYSYNGTTSRMRPKR